MMSYHPEVPQMIETFNLNLYDIYSYVHMKPLHSMFMKGNEVTLREYINPKNLASLLIFGIPL